MKKISKLLSLLLALALALALCVLTGCTEAELNDALDAASDIARLVSDESGAPEDSGQTPAGDPAAVPEEDGSYSSRDEVALYIYTYGRLPGNFVTKKEAQEAGWSGGSVDRYLPGKSIGGDRFGNREGLLPDKSGRSWTECDIDTLGASSRGAKRIVFSNDGLIYYSDDHYESFQLLYGQP